MGITERIDAVTLIPEVSRRPDPPAPKSVKIELTGRCNYRCGFCALRTREVQPKGDMDFDLFRRITKEMREAGVEEIGAFYLGESFMSPRLLVDAIRWCKTELEFPYVFLTTNGSLATIEWLTEVFKAGLDSIKFSINAYGDEQFEKVMGVKSDLFWSALHHLRVAKLLRDKHQYKCGVYASSIAYDDEQMEKMGKLINVYVRPFVDEHYWLPLYSMGSLATRREEELGYRPTAGNQGRLGMMREPLPCWSAWSGHVTSDGIMTACCFDADARWAMADLKSTRFMDAWHSAAFRTLREAHLKKDVSGTPCEECVAYQ